MWGIIHTFLFTKHIIVILLNKLYCSTIIICDVSYIKLVIIELMLLLNKGIKGYVTQDIYCRLLIRDSALLCQTK